MLSRLFAAGALLSVACLYLGGCNNSEPALPSPAEKPAVSDSSTLKDHKTIALDFGITPTEFHSTYNTIAESAGEIGKDLVMRQPLVLEQDGSFMQELPGAATYISGHVSKQTGKMDVLVIAINNNHGSAVTAGRSLLASIAAVRSASGLSVDSGVSKVVVDAFDDALGQIEKSATVPRSWQLGGYELVAAGIKNKGAILTLDRIK